LRPALTTVSSHPALAAHHLRELLRTDGGGSLRASSCCRARSWSASQHDPSRRSRPRDSAAA
jgi:hypothetical protein